MEAHVSTPYEQIDVDRLGKLGDRIYSEKYQDEFEKKYWGQFAEINIETGKAYVGNTSSEARAKARADSQRGFLFLVRIGHASAYHLS